jgi:hypothetical protein
MITIAVTVAAVMKLVDATAINISAPDSVGNLSASVDEANFNDNTRHRECLEHVDDELRDQLDKARQSEESLYRWQSSPSNETRTIVWWLLLMAAEEDFFTRSFTVLRTVPNSRRFLRELKNLCHKSSLSKYEDGILCPSHNAVAHSVSPSL